MQRKNTDDVNVIIVAAGSSTRFGGKTKKIFYKIAGIPVIVHSVRNFTSMFSQEDIIVVAGKDDIGKMENTLKKYSLGKVKICEGGRERVDSVFRGLLTADKRRVLIHDGARPFVSKKTIEDILRVLIDDKSCAAPAFAPTETVRTLKNDRFEILDRNNIFLMQTPQGCFREAYKSILSKCMKGKKYYTDDAEYFVKEGLKLMLVEGDKRNIKITVSEDIFIAEEIIKKGDSCL